MNIRDIKVGERFQPLNHHKSYTRISTTNLADNHACVWSIDNEFELTCFDNNTEVYRVLP